MKTKKPLIRHFFQNTSLLILVSTMNISHVNAQQAPQFEKASIDEIISAMTPEEKAESDENGAG